MSYTLHRQAEQDLEGSFAHYRLKGSDKVALRFLAEFERVAELIERNPELGTTTDADRRRYPFRTFPYSIVYKPVQNGIRILVVRHDRQDPRFGNERN